MILGNYSFDVSIELKEDIINVLVIENQHLFTKIITDLKNQTDGYDGSFTLFGNGNSMKISDKVSLIVDPLFHDINDRKLLNKLYSDITSISVGEEMYLDTKKMFTDLEKYLDVLIGHERHNLVRDEIDSVGGLLKLADVRFNVDTDIDERICDLISIYHEYMGTDIIIFVNLKSYLKSEEIVLLYRYAQYNKIHLILIESMEHERLSNEHVKIVDSDLCEIDFE